MKKLFVLLVWSNFIGFYVNAANYSITNIVFCEKSKLHISFDTLTPIQKKEFVFTFIEKNYELLKDSINIVHQLNIPQNYPLLIMANLGYADSTAFKTDFYESINYFSNAIVNIQNTDQDPIPKLPCTDKFITDVQNCLLKTAVACLFGWEAGVLEAGGCLLDAKADFDACLKMK